MNILVTGANGLLGSSVMTELRRRGHHGIAVGRAPQCRSTDAAAYVQTDLCDASAVQALFAGVQPDAVIHCAAWTDVDGAELPENREQVFAVNRDSTQNVAEASRDHGCKLLYVTTDYVFDGTYPAPYPADYDRFAPLNVYGQSKLDGERAVCGTLAQHFIVRTSWLYGAGGKNFVRTMLQLSRTHDTLRVVCDQVGTPTYVPDLARLLADMVETDRYGRYNAVNSGGYVSWYDFACEIFRTAGIPMTVLPVTTEEYGQSRAVRPRNSRLDTTKLAAAGFRPLPDWQDALARYLGQDADGAERYGMELQATLQLEVYSPGRRAGALCERAAAQVVDVFLGGIEGLYSGDLELGRTAYDARTDCFRCAVRAPLTLRLYTTAQDGAFTHADIRGVLQ